MDFEPVGAELPRIGQAPASVRVGESGEADAVERRAAGAEQDRRAIPEQAVDQIGGEESGSGRRTAFDQEMIDAGEVGDGVRAPRSSPTRRARRVRDSRIRRGLRSSRPGRRTSSAGASAS